MTSDTGKQIILDKSDPGQNLAALCWPSICSPGNGTSAGRGVRKEEKLGS